MGKLDDAPRVPVESVDQWRAWLTGHGSTSPGAWMVLWRPATGRPRITYEDAILEALCVGWIDGQAKPLDDERSMLWFAPRSPRSAWAGTNKARAALLVEQGRMLPAGQRLIDLAHENGMWTVLDGAEAGVEPPELSAALDADPDARRGWDGWTRGVRKVELTAIALARQEQTRSRRIADIAARAAAAGRSEG